MSTRAIYTFIDQPEWCEKPRKFRVYNHCDNYPEGAHVFIANALNYAWHFPRFEADEFACAFIAANKGSSGGFRLIEPHVEDMGQDYEYSITFNEKTGKLMVSFEYNEDGNNVLFNDSLEAMREKFKE